MGRSGTDVLDALPGAEAAVPYAATTAVAWRSSWPARVGDLQQLAQRCEVAAALRFMRTPVWQTANGVLTLADARYGVQGGFNVVSLPTAGPCTLAGKWIPTWTPPRAALLR
jgi:hypothetical protein